MEQPELGQVVAVHRQRPRDGFKACDLHGVILPLPPLRAKVARNFPLLQENLPRLPAVPGQG